VGLAGRGVVAELTNEGRGGRRGRRRPSCEPYHAAAGAGTCVRKRKKEGCTRWSKGHEEEGVITEKKMGSVFPICMTHRMITSSFGIIAPYPRPS